MSVPMRYAWDKPDYRTRNEDLEDGLSQHQILTKVKDNNTDMTANEMKGENPPPPYGATHQSHVRNIVTDHRGDLKLPLSTTTSISAACPLGLHIVIQIVGLRDDLPTFLAIGTALKSYGHRVRIATHSVFANLVASCGLEFFDIGGNPEALMEQMLQCSGILPTPGDLASGRLQALRKAMRSIMDRCWYSCFDNTQPTPYAEAFVADVIIANPLSHAHIHCAQKLGIPVHIVSTAPSSAIVKHNHLLTPVTPNLNSSVPSYASFELLDVVIWQTLRGTVNSFRRGTLALDAVDSIWTPGTIAKLKISHTFCWSPSLLPKPESCPRHIEVSGYCFPSQIGIDYMPSPDLAAFLAGQEPPVYINFSPVILTDFTVLENLIFEATRLAGVRAVICLGSGSVAATLSNTSANDRVFLLDNVPRDWILPQVQCIVHSGNSDVTAAALRLGKPSVTVPFFGDQAFWGDMVAQSGAGPNPIPFGRLTAENLAQAIQAALRPSCSDKAKMLAERIASENGADSAASNIIAQLPTSRIKCSISEDRTSVWKHKKHPSVKLSALAAAVLEDEGLLNTADLYLDRSVQYNLDCGPWEPVSGGTSAIAGLFFDTFHGIGEIGYDIANVFGTVHRLSNSLADGRDHDRNRVVGAHTVVRHNIDDDDDQSTKFTIPGYRALKGTGRIVKAAARAPMTFTYALAQGSHNMPHLWGDKLVRPQYEITGVWSGLTAGAKELFLGTYDGIAGLIEHPVVGAQQEGAKGFAKGIFHGVLGLPTRWFAAMSGVVGYPLKGIDAEIVRMVRGNPLDDVVEARIQQGRAQLQSIGLVERYAIVRRWNDKIAENGKKKQKRVSTK